MRPTAAAVTPVVLVVWLASAGCGDARTETTVESTITTSTTRPSDSTMVDDVTPVLPNAALPWEAGATYSAAGFWTPVQIMVGDDGWWSLGWDELWVHLEHRVAGRALPDLDLSIIAQSPRADPLDLIQAIAAEEHLEVVRGPRPTIVGGRTAFRIDVVAGRPPFPPECPDYALLGGGSTRFMALGMGVVLLTSHNPALPPTAWGFGVASCRAARIWTVDVHGSTITIIAAPTDPDEFDELIGLADAFTDGIEW